MNHAALDIAPAAPPGEAIADLADRFRRARRAALRHLAPPGTPEDALVPAALQANAEEAQRRTFENSLALGQGFVRYFGAEVPVAALPAVLSQLGVPCLHGAYRGAGDEPAIYLERAGCPDGALGPDACDLFREAIFGLVLGLTGGARHARHESVGHGGERCVDVIHLHPESPKRFGPIPDGIRGALARVSRLARAFDSAVEVEFLGVSEGVLLYRIARPGRAGEVSVRSLVERQVRRALPDLDICEITARPVLSDAD